MENSLAETKKNIPGWGVDSDPKVRPNVPMWKKPINGTGAHWTMPEQQSNFMDFYSVERPKPTHVFGTSCPPKGLSGLIRKASFKYSESDLRHWMGLLFADRVNVVEGYIEDVMNGVMPRPLLERGWRVDKKFKTARYYKVMGLTATAVVAPLAYFLVRNRSR